MSEEARDMRRIKLCKANKVIKGCCGGFQFRAFPPASCGFRKEITPITGNVDCHQIE